MRYICWLFFQAIANWLKDNDPDYDAERYRKFKEVEQLRHMLEAIDKDLVKVDQAPSHSLKSVSISYSHMDDADSDFLLDYYRYAHSRLRSLTNQVKQTINLADDS